MRLQVRLQGTVVKDDRMAQMEASDWSVTSCPEPEVTCFFNRGKPLTSWKKGSQAHATGSHVIWKGKPLTSWKKGSWAQGEVNPLRKRGLKVQSPIFGTGVVLDSKKQENKKK